MRQYFVIFYLACIGLGFSNFADASSHREAPIISADPSADNNDVYAFVSPDKPNTVTLIATYIPFEDPAGGPNYHRFADEVKYTIHIDNVGDAKSHIAFEFRFQTQVQNGNTFLYNVGPVASLTDPNLNMQQTFTVSRVDDGGTTVLGSGLNVAPTHVGPASTPNYKTLHNAAVHQVGDGVAVFAGPSDDPFFVDLGAIFDLLTIRPGAPGHQGGGVDGVAGYNCHTLALQVPISQLTRDGSVPVEASDPNAVIGVWATASRPATTTISADGQRTGSGDFVQVSRLGSPLVNEVVLPLGQKDIWNASKPDGDGQFLDYVTDPEPARLLNLLYGIQMPAIPRNDLVQIFLTGVPGLNQPPNVTPSEQLRLNMAIAPTTSPNPLGVIAGDLAGFPNGRRLVDDVTDIALRAVAGVLVEGFNVSPNNLLGDGVDRNDKRFGARFPYVALPHQGFNHRKFRTEPPTSGQRVRRNEALLTVTVLNAEGQEVSSGHTLEFARSVSGKKPAYEFAGMTDENGQIEIALAGGLYQARLVEASTNAVLGFWHSIAASNGKHTMLTLKIGQSAQKTSASLLQNSPNPFNPETVIQYRLSQPGEVRLTIYNVLGQAVRTLVDGTQLAGVQAVRWDARSDGGDRVSSGIYFYRLEAAGVTEQRKMLLLK